LAFTVIDNCSLLNEPKLVKALEYVSFVAMKRGGKGDSIRAKVGKRLSRIVDEEARNRINALLESKVMPAQAVAPPFPSDRHLVNEFPTKQK